MKLYANAFMRIWKQLINQPKKHAQGLSGLTNASRPESHLFPRAGERAQEAQE